MALEVTPLNKDKIFTDVVIGKNNPILFNKKIMQSKT